jgi:hypothetical protein
VVDVPIRPYHAGSQLTPVLKLECRGWDIVQWHPRDGWTADALESQSKWENIDLSDEWCEYDEKSEAPVGISDVSTSIQRA